MAESRKSINHKADDKRKDWRARSWQCVVYPESAPDDWMDKLHSQGVAYDISPLHDKDMKPDGSGLKKPHHHVVLDWGSGATTSGDRAIEIFNMIGGVYPDPSKNRQEFLQQCKVKKLISAQRYLCHLDEHDPNKHKYDTADVKSGFQELPYENRILKAMEKDELTMAMVDFVMEHDLLDFASFVLLARNEHPEWIHSIINERSGTFINRFIAGRLQYEREERERKKLLMTKWRMEVDLGVSEKDEIGCAVHDTI